MESDGPDHEMLQDFVKVTVKVLFFIGKIVYYYAMLIPVVSIVSTNQEYKIWKKTPTPMTILGIIKCYVFNMVWMAVCLIMSISLLPLWLQRGCGNSVQVEANAVMEKLVAIGIIRCFIGSVEIENAEKIPPISLFPGKDHAPAPIFVANHCSQLDTAVVYNVVRRFKWIAKESVQVIPGVGNLLSLGDHIFIKRKGKNKKSVKNLYEQSNAAIQDGVSMVIFPQGTRRMTTRLPFKDGAFKIAKENESKLVPISINIPLNAWNTLYPVNLIWKQPVQKIIVTIHDPIDVKKDDDIEELKKKCDDIIYSKLPPLYHGSDKKGD